MFVPSAVAFASWNDRGAKKHEKLFKCIKLCGSLLLEEQNEPEFSESEICSGVVGLLNASEAHETISTTYSGAWEQVRKMELRDAVLKTSLEAAIEQKNGV